MYIDSVFIVRSIRDLYKLVLQWTHMAYSLVGSGQVVNIVEAVLRKDPTGVVSPLPACATDNDFLGSRDLVDTPTEIIERNIDRTWNEFSRALDLTGAAHIKDNNTLFLATGIEVLPVHSANEPINDILGSHACHIDGIFC